MTDLKNVDLTPDLESCASEPIRLPGAVQPHGVLLAVSEPDLVVRVASANAESLLGVGVDALLGKRIGDASTVRWSPTTWRRRSTPTTSPATSRCPRR